MLRVYASRTNNDHHSQPRLLRGGTESHCDFGKILLGTLDSNITSHHRCLILGQRRQFVLIRLVALGRRCVILLLVPHYHVAAVWFVCYGIGISARNLLCGKLAASCIDSSLIFLRTSRLVSFYHQSVATTGQWSVRVVALYEN